MRSLARGQRLAIAALLSLVTSTLPAGLAPTAAHAAAGDLDPAYGVAGHAVVGTATLQASFRPIIRLDPLTAKAYVAAPVHDRTTGADTTAVFRFTAAGQPDTTFGDHGVVRLDTAGFPGFFAADFWVQADGRLAFAGSELNGSVLDLHLVRLTKAGAPDPTFGTGGEAVSPNWPALLGGLIETQPNHLVATTWLFGTPTIELRGFAPDGSPDAGFGTDGIVHTDFPATSAAFPRPAVTKTGRLVVAVSAQLSDGAGGLKLQTGVAGYRANGTLDPGFAGGQPVVVGLPGGSWSPRSIAALPGDGILIGGATTTSPAQAVVVRLGHGGRVLTAFGQQGFVTFGGGQEEVGSVVGVSAQRAVLGMFGGHATPGVPGQVVRLSSTDGSPDATFGAGGSAGLEAGAHVVTAAAKWGGPVIALVQVDPATYELRRYASA